MNSYARLLEPGALTIYLLHGVIERQPPGVRNYTVKHLLADRFRELCASLSASGTAVGADDAVAMIGGDEPLPDRAFLLSFDDGFLNNLTVAAPIMADHGIPGVFYVTSGFVEGNTASWIDLIEDAVDRTSRADLPLPWSGERMPTRTPEERIALLDEVRRVVKARNDLDPYAVASEFRDAAAVGDFVPHPDLDQKMTWEQVRELAGGDGFRVGGHSHSHRIMSFLPPGDLRDEVDTSLALLSGAIGEPVRHYSYPEGLAHCYSDEVIDVLRERGIVCAPTAEPGVNRPGDDLFRLRRYFVV
jgi:peptidoglycan/xylan/chitin deacetylase (PgdA/CDA1 family)